MATFEIREYQGGGNYVTFCYVKTATYNVEEAKNIAKSHGFPRDSFTIYTLRVNETPEEGIPVYES
jgi:hypothetical protein